MESAYDGRQIVGMDLHRRRSVLVRMTEDGRRLGTARITNSPQELRAQIARAGKSPKVVLEATYGWYWAADTLAAAGAEVHLAHPLGVKAFACRRVKNELDARDLADLLRMGRLPEAWIAPLPVRELRELTRYRAKLVSLRTSCKDQVHAVLAKLGIPVTCSDIFGKAGSAWLDGLRLPQPYAGKITSLRHLTGELTTEITMLSEVTADLLAGDRGYQVIQQLSGIGPVLAAVIIAEIGDVHRFRSAAQLCSWAGLTPRHRESDVKVTRGHVTEQGIAEAALGGHRGRPARAARLGNRRGQRCHHRPPREGSPQHRQGGRRPAAAHPGVLRHAGRPDPLPVLLRSAAGDPSRRPGL
jgi:transposase